MAHTLSYRLALDLGSASLGWAMFKLNAQGEPVAIIKAGVRIFSDGRNPKDGSSLAVSRRVARGMRRRRDRLLKRKARMLEKLVQYGFFPADEAERKKLESLNPYKLRADGLTKALKPEEFARALFHINQRRGFKSNRKTDKKEEKESGALKTAMSHLRQELKESQSLTVGAWLWQRMQKKESVRARYRETKISTDAGKNKIEKSYDLYVDRAMIEEEFDKLWAKQAEYNPVLFNDKARKDLKDTLLYQRKLRPVKPGRCTLLPEEERAPLALPSQQRFRIYQEVNNLRPLDSNLREIPLTLAQRDAVVAVLEKQKTVKFSKMRDLLGLPGSTKFNLEDRKREDLKGNQTSTELGKKEFFGDEWFKWSVRQQDAIVRRLLNQTNESRLVTLLMKYCLVDKERAEKIANVSLLDGYGSLSRKALERILPELKKEVITYDKAVQAAGFSHHSDLEFDFEYNDDEIAQIDERVVPSTGEIKSVYVFRQLPYYGKALHRHVGFGSGKQEDSEEKRYGKIANPTVHIGLNQVRVVVNALIRRYGRPAEVVVEVARELKRPQDHRKREFRKFSFREQDMRPYCDCAECEKVRQKKNQDLNKELRTLAATLLGCSESEVSVYHMQKLRLYKDMEQESGIVQCPYSGKTLSPSTALDSSIEIDHIIPYCKSLDDSRANKVLCLREANRLKGDRTPYDAKELFEQHGWSWHDIEQRISNWDKKKRFRFGENAMQEWLHDHKDFLARALNDTRYLSRVAAEYLRLVCPGTGTRVIPGQMTALLRGKFGLNEVLGLNGEKNRNDHRHHAVDACVIGVTDQGMLQKFANASASAREQQLNRLVDDMPLPWETYRTHVERAVEHIKVSHKPDHGYEGTMMEETSYGIRKDGSIKQKKAEGREISNVIRIIEPKQQERHGVDAEGNPLPYKGYVGGSNYCIEVIKTEKGKWKGEVIQTYRAYQIVRTEGEARLRHPHLSQSGKPLVMRLMINDCVRLEVEGKEQMMRVAGVNQAGNVWMSPVHEANVDARNRNKNDPFTYTYKSGDAFRKAKARRVTISPIGEINDPGFKG